MSHFYALLFNSQFFQYDWFWAFLIQLLHGLSEANSVYWPLSTDVKLGPRTLYAMPRSPTSFCPSLIVPLPLSVLRPSVLFISATIGSSGFPIALCISFSDSFFLPLHFPLDFLKCRHWIFPSLFALTNLSPPRHLLPLQSFQMSHIIGLGGKVVFFLFFTDFSRPFSLLKDIPTSIFLIVAYSKSKAAVVPSWNFTHSHSSLKVFYFCFTFILTNATPS